MDFAPYQSDEPSASRTNLGGSGTYTPPPVPRSTSTASPPPPPVYSSSPNAYAGGSSSTYGPPAEEQQNVPVNQYETSIPLRLDYESVLAYGALPPVGSVALLVFETKNDYIRFHSWQACLLFTPLFILFIILSFSTILSYLVLAVYIVFAVYMAYRAYRDSSSLERLELPVIGRLASDWVDSE
ncbi:hypothetical protein POJ06DRAFT_253420 [Lipomyces tetrasporus]|uniref:Uncharacterized protein n=1 Tax=Lipomyces tetrasporus TaxID=54092 RepID=A0AAD7VST0_9ASCO|nr:uncharacterized protein POJ06DRAFT_253420 [Lipomyces tetrasporus]KAJ8100688.1 hypothetical protein POJ06DRAFT_253420 [Lipomyces tetrasporus]